MKYSTLVCVLVIGCASQADQPKPRPRQVHFLLELDLSDRILAPHQVEKDKAIIAAVVDIFLEEVRRKYYINSKDRLQVIPFRQKNNPDAFRYRDYLSIDVADIPLAERVDALPALRDTLFAYVDTLYAQALCSDRFYGADIWEYFNEDFHATPVTAIGDSVTTVAIVLTDAYIVAEDRLITRGRKANYIPTAVLRALRSDPDWEKTFEEGGYGLLPLSQDFHGANVAVLVLEVSPRPYFNELAILTKYWTSWLKPAGIRSVELYKTNASARATREAIRRHLQQTYR